MERDRYNAAVWDIYDERKGRVHVGMAIELIRGGFAVRIWYRGDVRWHARNLGDAIQEVTACVERLPA